MYSYLLLVCLIFSFAEKFLEEKENGWEEEREWKKQRKRKREETLSVLETSSWPRSATEFHSRPIDQVTAIFYSVVLSKWPTEWPLVSEGQFLGSDQYCETSSVVTMIQQWKKQEEKWWKRREMDEREEWEKRMRKRGKIEKDHPMKSVIELSKKLFSESFFCVFVTSKKM